MALFPPEAALLPPRPPLPHAKRSLLWQCIPQLSRQRADLSAMMRIVRDQVAKHTDHVRAEALNLAFGVVERFGQKPRAALPAFGERSHCLFLRDRRGLDLIW